MSDGDPFGALTLYAEEPNAFNERTVEQFTELANNLAYGVIALRTREERRRAQAELQKQRIHLDELFELAPAAIALMDVDNRVIRVNEEFTRVFGYALEEAVGRNIFDLIVPDELRNVAQSYKELVTVGQRVDAESVRRRKDGTRLHVSFVVAPVSVAGGQIAIYSMYQDMTERKQAEEDLRKAQADLAHVTRVTTLGEMTASIAHEVNQPLAAVVTNGQACLRWLARQSPDLEEARDALGRIIKEGNRASEVIGRIRALVKKSPPRRDQLDINDIILEVIALTRGEVQQNRVALQAQLSDDLPLVLGDRVQVQQVVLNLVMNGIEAMSAVTERSRELLIRSVQHESGQVLVAVKDSGIGLQPGSLDHLFEAFFTTKPKGMGMGLAISRSIIETHGGRLWAAPNDGPGATFQFTLDIGIEEERPLIV